jgi:putative membrane protein
MMHYFYGQHFAYPMMGFGGGWILWILGALLIALVVFVIVRMANGHGHSESCHAEEAPSGKELEKSVALRILDERYAKGEITDEEYKTKKMNLL